MGHGGARLRLGSVLTGTAATAGVAITRALT